MQDEIGLRQQEQTIHNKRDIIAGLQCPSNNMNDHLRVQGYRGEEKNEMITQVVLCHVLHKWVIWVIQQRQWYMPECSALTQRGFVTLWWGHFSGTVWYPQRAGSLKICYNLFQLIFILWYLVFYFVSLFLILIQNLKKFSKFRFRIYSLGRERSFQKTSMQS